MNSSSDETMELLIESELNIPRREATEAPLSESKVRAEEEIIISNYGPFAAFDKAIGSILEGHESARELALRCLSPTELVTPRDFFSFTS
jgi:hypothetical protein